MNTPPTVAIVDAYSSANRLADAFAAEGYRCVRVQSTPRVPAQYQSDVDLTRYQENVVHNGSLADTAGAVGRHRPVAVIAGAEQGVELADQLSETLGLPGNCTELSYARRTKNVQIDTVRAAGLATARQLLVTSPDQLAEWHRDIAAMIVVKPIRSARNDGVAFCDTPTESIAAYRHLASAHSVFDVPNEGIVAQEYLCGTEFVVNTVSCQGHHRVTDIWRYTKIHVNGVRDRINGIVLVPQGNPEHEALTGYSFAVLDALAIRYGPGHLEVMMTADGPRLVEIGARLCGSDVAEYAVLATGESQVDRTIQAYTAAPEFLADLRRPYRLSNHAAMAFLVSPVEGKLRGYPLLPQVEALESYIGCTMVVKPGDPLRRTVDDTTEPIVIGLCHHDHATVEKDFATVCYLDGPGFYDVEPGE